VNFADESDHMLSDVAPVGYAMRQLPDSLQNKCWACGNELLVSGDLGRVLVQVALVGHARNISAPYALDKRRRDQAYRLLKREGLIERRGTRGYRLCSKES
jgi:hypothetical protein